MPKRAPKMTADMRRMLEGKMGRVPFALNQLLTRSKISWAWKLEPEELLSIQLADRLRALSMQYQETGSGLRAIWCHVPNEGKRSQITHLIMRAMGMLKGSWDFWFVWDGGGAIIELKVEGTLTIEQQYFETWAQCLSVRKGVHRTVQGAIDSLTAWGAIV